VPVRGLGELAATGFAAAGSAEWRTWIAAVPSLIVSLARQWDLTIDSEEFRHGYSAVVLPVGQRGRPLVLKLAWPPDRVRQGTRPLARLREAHDIMRVFLTEGRSTSRATSTGIRGCSRSTASPTSPGSSNSSQTR
jgi:hypothetical protein